MSLVKEHKEVSLLNRIKRFFQYIINVFVIFPFVLLHLYILKSTIRFEDTYFVNDGQPGDDVTEKQSMYLLWHEYELMIPFLFFHYRRKHAKNSGSGKRVWSLISQHRDGKMIELFMRLLGVYAVKGSSTRGGRSAYRGLSKVLQKGDHISITPDGPKGPRRKLKRGAYKLAVEYPDVRVVLFAFASSSNWRMKSWDRIIIPKPFSKVRLVVDMPELIDEDPKLALKDLENKISSLADIADSLYEKST